MNESINHVVYTLMFQLKDKTHWHFVAAEAAITIMTLIVNYTPKLSHRVSHGHEGETHSMY